MVLHKPGSPLKAMDLPVPQPAGGEVRIKVQACGVCRTDLHILDGELSRPKLPLVMGHQIVGTIDRVGAAVTRCRGLEVYAFTRPGDEKGQSFARRLGAEWAGGSDALPPLRLDAVIIFAPVGGLVPQALQALRAGEHEGSIVLQVYDEN